MTTKKLHILLLVGVAFFTGYFFGTSKVSYSWSHYHPNLTILNKEAPQTSSTTVDMSLFWKTWDTLNQKYYDKKKLDPQKMLNGAISGLTQSIDDPYTMFLPPMQNSSFQQQLRGQFQGIGAELGLSDDKQIIVIAPLDGSPAKKAGILAGDSIIKVDNQATDGWTTAQAVEKIRGPKGTKVDLTVVRKGDTVSHDIDIIRDTITVKSVDGWIKTVEDINKTFHLKIAGGAAGNSVMYLRLSQFGDSTNQDWGDLVKALSAKMKTIGGVKGIVFDLRNNPGGYLPSATFVAGEFLKQGTSVVIEDPGIGITKTLSVDRQGLLLDVPLVILLNKGSASASEIVAGAMRDNKRAQLVGDTSFGKGTIQEAMDLGNNAGLHVTIAKWLTPNGTWVHGKGLTPDVAVTIDSKDPSHDTQLEKAVELLLQ